MWPFLRIVYPSDACPQCRKTLAQAVELAEKCRSQLVVLDTSRGGKSDPAGRIVELANGGRANLIFMPRHGSGNCPGGLESTITAVLARAKCPVWIAPAREPKEGGPVLCAMEPRPGGEEHLDSAASIAQAYGRPLHLIHAVPEVGGVRQRLAAFERAMAWLLEFRRRLARSAEVAVRAAASRGASLLVIGHGKCGGTPVHLGSHAYRIAREASCPVLVGAPTASVSLTREKQRAA